MARTLDSAGMIARLVRWVERYPIVSVEDGLAEDDWEWWPTLRLALAEARIGGGRRPALHQPGAHPPRH